MFANMSNFIFNLFSSCGKENNTEKGSSQRQTEEGHEVAQSGGNRLSADREPSEISRAAAELVQSFDLSENQEKHFERPAPLKFKETSDDEVVVLPRWQQKQQQEVHQQGGGTDEKKSSSSTSSSQGSSGDDQFRGEPQPQVQQWQSVVSALVSSSSGSQGTKAEAVMQASNCNKQQSVQVVDVSFFENSEAVPLISKAECPKEAPQGNQLSLSPSSLAIDPFKPDDGNGKGTEESPVLIPGPTQPVLSEDMFCPVVTQEQQDISGFLCILMYYTHPQ